MLQTLEENGVHSFSIDVRHWHCRWCFDLNMWSINCTDYSCNGEQQWIVDSCWYFKYKMFSRSITMSTEEKKTKKENAPLRNCLFMMYNTDLCILVLHFIVICTRKKYRTNVLFSMMSVIKPFIPSTNWLMIEVKRRKCSMILYTFKTFKILRLRRKLSQFLSIFQWGRGRGTKRYFLTKS